MTPLYPSYSCFFSPFFFSSHKDFYSFLYAFVENSGFFLIILVKLRIILLGISAIQAVQLISVGLFTDLKLNIKLNKGKIDIYVYEAIGFIGLYWYKRAQILSLSESTSLVKNLILQCTVEDYLCSVYSTETVVNNLHFLRATC